MSFPCIYILCFVLSFGVVACTENILLNQVGPAGDVEEMAVTRIVIVPDSAELVNGQRQEFTAQAFAGNLLLDANGFIWASTNSSVAQIESVSGADVRIKAEGPGSANITATLGAVSDFAEIRVVSASPGE